MCGRYKLEEHWQEYFANPFFDWDNPPYPFDNPFKGSDEVFPRERMPIIRRCEDGKLRPELRQWGFIMMINRKTIDPATGTPKKVRKDVFNAMSEKLASSFTWRFAFTERRCLIPMSSWDEWPETGAGKQRVRVSMPGEPVFMAAGLYETSVDPKTGDRVPTYTMVTVPPNEFLGTVHDRAPMVLMPSQYQAWLAGGEAALALASTHPKANAFEVRTA